MGSVAAWTGDRFPGREAGERAAGKQAVSLADLFASPSRTEVSCGLAGVATGRQYCPPGAIKIALPANTDGRQGDVTRESVSGRRREDGNCLRREPGRTRKSVSGKEGKAGRAGEKRRAANGSVNAGVLIIRRIPAPEATESAGHK